MKKNTDRVIIGKESSHKEPVKFLSTKSVVILENNSDENESDDSSDSEVYDNLTSKDVYDRLVAEHKNNTRKCEVCEKLFDSHQELREHLFTHAGYSQECQIGGKILSSQSETALHEKTHSPSPNAGTVSDIRALSANKLPQSTKTAEDTSQSMDFSDKEMSTEEMGAESFDPDHNDYNKTKSEQSCKKDCAVTGRLQIDKIPSTRNGSSERFNEVDKQGMDHTYAKSTSISAVCPGDQIKTPSQKISSMLKIVGISSKVGSDNVAEPGIVLHVQVNTQNGNPEIKQEIDQQPPKKYKVTENNEVIEEVTDAGPNTSSKKDDKDLEMSEKEDNDDLEMSDEEYLENLRENVFNKYLDEKKHNADQTVGKKSSVCEKTIDSSNQNQTFEVTKLNDDSINVVEIPCTNNTSATSLLKDQSVAIQDTNVLIIEKTLKRESQTETDTSDGKTPLKKAKLCLKGNQEQKLFPDKKSGIRIQNTLSNKMLPSKAGHTVLEQYEEMPFVKEKMDMQIPLKSQESSHNIPAIQKTPPVCNEISTSKKTIKVTCPQRIIQLPSVKGVSLFKNSVSEATKPQDNLISFKNDHRYVKIAPKQPAVKIYYKLDGTKTTKNPEDDKYVTSSEKTPNVSSQWPDIKSPDPTSNKNPPLLQPLHLQSMDNESSISTPNKKTPLLQPLTLQSSDNESSVSTPNKNQSPLSPLSFHRTDNKIPLPPPFPDYPKSPPLSPTCDTLRACATVRERFFDSKASMENFAKDHKSIPYVRYLLDQSSNIDDFLGKLLAQPFIKKQIEFKLLSSIYSNMDTSFNNKSSVLSTFGSKLTMDTNVKDILDKATRELYTRSSFLFQVLLTGTFSMHFSTFKKPYIIPLIYAMMMECRSQRNSIIQKVVRATCSQYDTHPVIGKMLTQFGLAYANNITFLENMARGNKNSKQEDQSESEEDNTEPVAEPPLPPELDLDSLSDTPKCPELPADLSVFYLNQQEEQQLRRSYAVTVCKAISSLVEPYKILKSCLPEQHPHKHKEILEKYEEKLKKQTPIKREKMKATKKSKNQYTEETLTKPEVPKNKKKATTWHHVLEGLLYIERDLLGKIVSNFFDPEQSTIEGVISNLKKCAKCGTNNTFGAKYVRWFDKYKYHKDFIIAVTDVLLVELSFKLLGTDKDNPDHTLPPIPDQIFNQSELDQLEWFTQFVTPVVDHLFVALKPSNLCRKIVIPGLKVCDKRLDITAPQDLAGSPIHVIVNGTEIKIGLKQVEDNPHTEFHCPHIEDDIMKYSTAFLRCSLDFIEISDVIKSGDIKQLNIVLKRLVPVSLGLTSKEEYGRSKYPLEIVKFLTYTELILSEKESTLWKLGAISNPKGNPTPVTCKINGTEYVKLKSDRTENQKNSQLHSCKQKTNYMKRKLKFEKDAAPCIQHLANSLTATLEIDDNAVNETDFWNSEEKRQSDQLRMLEKLGEVKPFNENLTRKFGDLSDIKQSPLCKVNVEVFHGYLKQFCTKELRKNGVW